MSEIMLGVLGMPDDLFWSDETMTRYQHNQIRKQAAAEIRRLRRVEAAARDYYEGYARDEADDDAVEMTGCTEDQHLAATQLRDALSYNT